jgi:hypothetical protein
MIPIGEAGAGKYLVERALEPGGVGDGVAISHLQLGPLVTMKFLLLMRQQHHR